jgi:tetraacyldisaccharide 4'-kinase
MAFVTAPIGQLRVRPSLPQTLVRFRWALAPLLPLLWLYRLIVAARNFCFDRGIFKSTKLPALVISIGNLSAGGTGKTPMTIFLAETLRDQGWKAAIVARGYRREKSGLTVVSDGKQILAGIADAGDEPLLMAQACEGVPVVVDRKKLNAARAAVAHFAPDVILVDDGFQHRQLHRDIDIVMLDAATPLRNAWSLAGVITREPASSLRRADFIILNISGQNERQRLVAQCRQYTAAKIFTGALQGIGWRELHVTQSAAKKEIAPLDFVKAQPVLLVSGIAHPERFREQAEIFGARIVSEMKFWDHYRYQKNDIQTIESTRKACGARYILTTSKDAGKLATLSGAAAMPFLVLETRFVMNAEFLPAFFEAVQMKRKARENLPWSNQP